MPCRNKRYYIFWVCVSSLSYPACIVCLCRITLSSVVCQGLQHFFNYLINGMIFRKKLLKIKCVFWLSLQLLSERFLILSRIQQDIIINVHTSSHKVPIILVRFSWNLNFRDRVFEKYSNIKFHENLFSGSRVVPCRRTDR